MKRRKKSPPIGGIFLKSYLLAIVVTMFLSALFAYQNIGEVTVRFLFFEWTLPQGVWEVIIFSAGAALLWFFSLFSVFEVRGKYKKELKARDEKIETLTQEKKSILESIAAKPQTAAAPAAAPQSAQPAVPQTVESQEKTPAAETAE